MSDFSRRQAPQSNPQSNPGPWIDPCQVLTRLDRLPLTWMQGKILAQGGISTFLDGLDTGIVSFILPVITVVFSLTGFQEGLFGSAALAGALIGDVLLGLLGSDLGRKPLLVWSLCVYSGAIIIGAFSLDWQFLLLTRFIAGIGIGVSVNVVGPYLAEFAPRKQRANYVGSLAAFFGLSFVAAALLGLMIPTLPWGWRLVHLIVGLPILLAFWWRKALPESPRYLILKGRVGEAERVVAALEESVRHQSGTLRDLDEVICRCDGVDAPENRRIREFFGRQFLALWNPHLARRTSVLWATTLSLSFAYYGFLTFLPTPLMNRGMRITESFGYSLIVELAQVLGYFPAAWMSERWDRKWSVTTLMAASVLCALWLALASSNTQVLLASAALGFFLNGAYAPMYAYTSEIYPTSTRAAGSAFSDAISRIGAAVAPLIIGVFYSSLNFVGVFGMITIVLLLGALAILVFGANTSGKSLEDLTAHR